MEKTPLRNPYEEIPDEPRYAFGKPFAWGAVSVFLLLLVIPCLFAFSVFLGDDAPSLVSNTLEGQLREWETHFEESPLFERWRVNDQALLVRWFAEGNSRVVIGRDGWLFYRPDIDAAIGKGPRYVEPTSVARAPSDKKWNRPLPIVKQFAGQLEERGISLVLVPVPTKAMIETDGFSRHLDDGPSFRLPADWDSVRGEIESYGVEFVDLVPLFSQLAEEGEVFLRQDTHWTPETMARAAERIAQQISGTSNGELPTLKQRVERESRGDLVDMLQLEDRTKGLFPPEKVQLTRVLDPALKKSLENETDSPLVLLGDSFVNVFEDPDLGFSVEGEERIGAGLSSHLAEKCGQALHVIAINGGGATDVRKAFAGLPEDEVQKKKTVVWVLSARDLFLAEIPGRRAGISWQPVQFSNRKSHRVDETDPLILTGILSERSEPGDPKQTPYASALYSGIFKDLDVESGSYEAEEAWVFLWAFRERKWLPSAGLQPGRRYRLTLKPLPTSGPESSATQVDDFFRIDLERLFSAEYEEVE